MCYCGRLRDDAGGTEALVPSISSVHHHFLDPVVCVCVLVCGAIVCLSTMCAFVFCMCGFSGVYICGCVQLLVLTACVLCDCGCAIMCGSGYGFM